MSFYYPHLKPLFPHKTVLQHLLQDWLFFLSFRVTDHNDHQWPHIWRHTNTHSFVNTQCLLGSSVPLDPPTDRSPAQTHHHHLFFVGSQSLLKKCRSKKKLNSSNQFVYLANLCKLTCHDAISGQTWLVKNCYVGWIWSQNLEKNDFEYVFETMFFELKKIPISPRSTVSPVNSQSINQINLPEEGGGVQIWSLFASVADCCWWRSCWTSRCKTWRWRRPGCWTLSCPVPQERVVCNMTTRLRGRHRGWLSVADSVNPGGGSSPQLLLPSLKRKKYLIKGKLFAHPSKARSRQIGWPKMKYRYLAVICHRRLI